MAQRSSATLGLTFLSALMLILSFAFFKAEGSGSVPLILLFFGIGFAGMVLVGFIVSIGKDLSNVCDCRREKKEEKSKM